MFLNPFQSRDDEKERESRTEGSLFSKEGDSGDEKERQMEP